MQQPSTEDGVEHFEPWSAIVVFGYDAREFGLDGQLEHGYLCVQNCDRVQVLSPRYPGHCRNRFDSYVFAKIGLLYQQGWLPTSCLQRTTLRGVYSARTPLLQASDLGTSLWRRPVCRTSWNDEHQTVMDDQQLVTSIPTLATVGRGRTTSSCLVRHIISAFLGEPLLQHRAICQNWARIQFAPDQIRLKVCALFSSSAVLVVAQFLEREPNVLAVRLPFRGGCLQRIRTLELARQIQERVERTVHFLLDGFFGFLDTDSEREELDLLGTLREAGLRLESETGLELLPGDGGRVFATDLFESSFFTVAHVMRFEFQGGYERLSIRMRNITGQPFLVTQVTYDIACTSDFSSEVMHSGQLYAHIPPVEGRLNHLPVSRVLDVECYLMPWSHAELPILSIPIGAFLVQNDQGSVDRLSLYQRVQICGCSLSGVSREAPVVLVSTGWLHVVGPDGSEGATIVGDVGDDEVAAGILPNLVPMDLLAERATGLPGMISDQRNYGHGNDYEYETRVSHVMQFRTFACGHTYRSIVHVRATSRAATELFALGSPREAQHEARRAAALTAVALLDSAGVGAFVT